MEERIYNYCPYCGVKILKSHNHQINYCPNCGQKLKLEKYDKHDKVQCVVCHRYIWSGRFDTIECSFCGSKYHTKCVFSWLIKYNSCPLCQNVFLKPSIIKVIF
jgi:hypothetical protein